MTIFSFPEFLLCLEDATRTRTALWTSCNLSKTKQDLDINHHFNSQNCALHPTEGLHLHLKWLILISSRTPKWRNAAAMCLVTPRLGRMTSPALSMLSRWQRGTLYSLLQIERGLCSLPCFSLLKNTFPPPFSAAAKWRVENVTSTNDEWCLTPRWVALYFMQFSINMKDPDSKDLGC